MVFCPGVLQIAVLFVGLWSVRRKRMRQSMHWWTSYVQSCVNNVNPS